MSKDKAILGEKPSMINFFKNRHFPLKVTEKGFYEESRINKVWDQPHYLYQISISNVIFNYHVGTKATFNLEEALRCIIEDCLYPRDFEDYCEEFGFPNDKKSYQRIKSIVETLTRNYEKLLDLLGHFTLHSAIAHLDIIREFEEKEEEKQRGQS